MGVPAYGTPEYRDHLLKSKLRRSGERLVASRARLDMKSCNRLQKNMIQKAKTRKVLRAQKNKTGNVQSDLKAVSKMLDDAVRRKNALIRNELVLKRRAEAAEKNLLKASAANVKYSQEGQTMKGHALDLSNKLRVAVDDKKWELKRETTRFKGDTGWGL
jgi:outer membrane PBP1 activator LpoA protein